MKSCRKSKQKLRTELRCRLFKLMWSCDCFISALLHKKKYQTDFHESTSKKEKNNFVRKVIGFEKANYFFYQARHDETGLLWGIERKKVGF